MTNSQKDFLNKRKKENFYKKAKEINVRARSYFKLEQVDKKFNLIKNNLKIIDLGCAPGGWLQYVDKKIVSGKIIGIDLLEVKNQKEFSDKVEIIEDDFNNIDEYNFGEFDLIISDMAPEFSGDSQFDKGRTHKLNLISIDFSKKNLKKGGNLLFKSFEGEDLNYVKKSAEKVFERVKEFKPSSSQKKSAETFIICFNKL